MEISLGKNINELCRLCLAQDEQMVPIYDDDAVPLPLRIMACVDLEVYENDGLPTMICHPCKYQLDKSYQFKKKCQGANLKLRKHIKLINSQYHNENQEGNENSSSINGKLRQIKNLSSTNLVPIKHDVDQDNDLAINVTEKDLLDGYNYGMETETLEREIPEELERIIENAEKSNEVLMMEFTGGNSSFTDDDVALREIDNTFEEKKVFKCSQCPMAFTRRMMLKSHQTVHSTQRGFTCQACEKWFPTNSALIRHERVHTGEKPFSCNVCQRAFAQKEILLRHLMTHSGDKPFKCKDCDKAFTQREALRVHSRQHKKLDPSEIVMYHCQLCEKAFCHASGLSRHLITHTGRKYKCTQCNKSFTDKSSLVRHSRIHGSRE